MLFITCYLENSQIFQEFIEFWAAKAAKIIKILDFFQKCLFQPNLLLNFNAFIKR